MDVEGFIEEIRNSGEYAGQIVYLRQVQPRQAAHGKPAQPLPAPLARMLAGGGIEHLYSHQARAIDLARQGRDIVVSTGTASGKSLCYILPILESLLAGPAGGKALLLFPTKALCQDQFRSFSAALSAAGIADVLAGVHDGDTPSATRRRLRDNGSVIFTNPDMLHAAILPAHARWAEFLGNLRWLVIDEVHTYSGIFGANAANLFRRFWRICRHYGSRPQVLASSATIGNPRQLTEALTGRPVELIDQDGSPRGRRTYVFWNPPRLGRGNWHSRRSANVEAHNLMAGLIRRGAPTITFSKSKMTAEMIHRYVCERLQQLAPDLAGKVTPYRGGYRPEERRRIEKRLFGGELLGVSSTRALELGIDVGALEASILVGYPGTLASFFQQSGRAGRRDRDCLVVLVGLDTAINQYVMSHPEYLFGRPVEQGILDVNNPFVITGHLRCAAHERPLEEQEVALFGPYAPTVLNVLRDNRKVRLIDGRWYHAAGETPQHELSLRDSAEANVVIENAANGEVLGEVNRFDASPILHPQAIYMHLGETYRVQELDLERNIARVEPAAVDYYTNPLGGTDVHHVDHCLRDRPFGTGRACWGEVTAYFHTWGYEKIHFYSLEPISAHPVELPTLSLDTMAFWLVPPEELMDQVRRASLNVHSGLRGIGYATRMLLPLLMTCDTLDFSHSIGSVNSPWNAIFIYERYPHGLGFTEKAYELLHELMPRVLDNIRACVCEDGCPCCVGKPLRQYATWNVELGEASIPSKAAATMILQGLLGDGGNLRAGDTGSLTDSDADENLRVEQALRRRLERMRQPKVFHPIEPAVPVQYPEAERPELLQQPDVAVRNRRRDDFHKLLRRRIAKRIETNQLSPHAAMPPPPEGMKKGPDMPPTAFPGSPRVAQEKSDKDIVKPDKPIELGDNLAARARKRKKQKDEPT